MRLIILISFLIPLLSNGQTRTITGKVIDENFEAIPEVKIQNHDTLRLGATDNNGNFKIELPSGTDELLLSFLGMEWTSLKVPTNCNNLEIIMMFDTIYDFVTIGTENKKRYKRLRDLPNKHRQAIERRIFSSSTSCFTYIF